MTAIDYSCKRGDVNGYRCDTCGRHTYIVHVDDGVTPMFLACRAEGVDPEVAQCKGMGTSLMYPPPPVPQYAIDAVRFEWVKPSPRRLRRMTPEMQEHCRKGGLELRPLSGHGRRALGLIA